MATQTLKTGVVIGTLMQRTAKVRIEHLRIHPIVLKQVKTHSNVFVHDPYEICAVGDIISFVACAKVSKNKKNIVVDIVRPAKRTVLDGILYSAGEHCKSL